MIPVLIVTNFGGTSHYGWGLRATPRTPRFKILNRGVRGGTRRERIDILFFKVDSFMYSLVYPKAEIDRNASARKTFSISPRKT